MEGPTEVSIVSKIIARYPSSSPQPLLSDKILMQPSKLTQNIPIQVDIDSKILSDLLSTSAKAPFHIKTNSSPKSNDFFKPSRLLKLESELENRRKAFKQLRQNFQNLQLILLKPNSLIKDKSQEMTFKPIQAFSSITSDLLEIKFKLFLIAQRLELLDSKLIKKN